MLLLLTVSISILDSKQVIFKFEVIAKEWEKYLFITSLMGTTIQDGGKRERSNILYYTLLSKFKIKIIKTKNK